MDAREQRLAQNEALFREVNERIEAAAHTLGPHVEYEFLCECANADCTFPIALTLETYEAVRADGPSSSSSYRITTRPRSRTW